MTTINTGPTATVMHHFMAWAHELTGIEPLWLFAASLTAVIAVGCLSAWAVDKALERRSHSRSGALPHPIRSR